jgi:hypothetical protein
LRSTSCNEIQNFFGKGDNHAAGKGQKAIGPLGRVVGFERKADLHNAEAQQDQTDGPDQPEYEVGQVVDDGQRVVGRIGR